MGTQKDNTLVDKLNNEPSRLEDLKKLMGLLHDYLPKNFPDVTFVSDKKNIFNAKSEDGIINVKMDREGNLISEFDPRFISEYSFGLNVFMQFLRQYNGDVTAEFEIAGLPWTFNLSAFVKRYAPLLYKEQMKEILEAMNAKESTYKTYLKKFRKLFKDEEFNQFIKRFIALAEAGLPKAVYDCDKGFLHKLGVTENQLNEWNSEGLFSEKKEVLLDESSKAIKLVFYY